MSTLQATILLHFNTHSDLPVKKLKEDLLKDTILDDDLFTQLLEPLLAQGVLVRVGEGTLKVKASLASGTLNAYSTLRASSTLHRRKLLQGGSNPQQEHKPSHSASGESYVHKEHKFKLQAFIIKHFKKKGTDTIGSIQKLS